MYTSLETFVSDDSCTKTTNCVILQRGGVIVSLIIEKYKLSKFGLVCQHCSYVAIAADQVSGFTRHLSAVSC